MPEMLFYIEISVRNCTRRFEGVIYPPVELARRLVEHPEVVQIGVPVDPSDVVSCGVYDGA